MSENSTSTEQQIKAALGKLNMDDIVFAVSQLALKVLSNQPLDETEYTVKLSVPAEIAKVFEAFAKTVDLPVNDLIGQFAKQGFSNAIQQQLNQAKQPVTPPIAPSVEQDIETALPGMGANIMEGLGKIQALAEQLGSLQKVVENVANSTDPTNSQQSDVPTGTSPKS